MAFPTTHRICGEETTRPSPNGDCAPCSIIMWLDETSGGLLDVGLRTVFGNTAAQMKNIRVDYVQEIRVLAGQAASFTGAMPDSGRTLAMNGGSAGNAWTARFLAIGLKPPRFTAYNNTLFSGAFIADIQGGRGAMLSIGYGPIDWYPKLVSGFADYPIRHTISGQWRFKDGHSLCVRPGSYVGGPSPTVILQDPLADGRVSSSTIADHGTAIRVFDGQASDAVVPVSVLKTAAGLYGGASLNKVVGNTWTFAAASTSADPQQIIIITAQNPTHVTTQAAHGLTTGNTITITGSDSTPVINGVYVVTVLDTTHFTIPLAVTGVGSTGSWTQVIGGPPISDPCG